MNSMDFELGHGAGSRVQSITPIKQQTNASISDSNFDLPTDENNLLLSSLQMKRMQIALAVVVRLMLPLFNGVARGYEGIRSSNILRVFRNVRASRQILTNLIAENTISLSLSTVQVVHKIEPLLKMMKFRKTIPENRTTEEAVRTKSVATRAFTDWGPEKCVTVNVLAEPPPGSPIRADIIFIHGLHGSLINTWKQGLWNSEGRRVNFQRPPKPPIRPPKRPRHSRNNPFDPPHRSKRAKICPHSFRPNITRSISIQSSISTRSNSSSSIDTLVATASEKTSITPLTSNDDCVIDYAYNCDVTGDDHDDVIEYLTDMEQSFPTFRLRDDEEPLDDNVDGDEGIHMNRPVSSASTESSQRSAEYSRCWPGDWLPLDCPGVRVIAVNYTTDPYLWRPIWIRKRNRTSLAVRAREMMELLTDIGVGVGHPIVWVGHSKGGIFAKQMMVDAWESGKAALAPLWRSSRGCVFYSVPHRGSPLADFNLPLVRQSAELKEIKKNCPEVLELHRRFVALYRIGHLKIQIFSFIETALTLMSVLYLRIVGIDSADPGIGEVCGIHLDHREICKPRDRDCILYTKLTSMINKVS